MKKKLLWNVMANLFIVQNLCDNNFTVTLVCVVNLMSVSLLCCLCGLAELV